AARSAGADGALIVDYPPEEARQLVETLDAAGLDTVFLLSPTTSEARLKQVAALGRGYLYYVSLKGVTGAANIDVADVSQHISRIRKFTKLPVGVGFGISDGETARAIGQIADAVVIGSRLVREIEAAPEQAAAKAGAFMADIRKAMDRKNGAAAA
ncbi:MAG: tryptophan synthase subunit alpha, partial [Betaproteobacteria bacterium]|nr:tryptophan synthase subunit alpha [Betaproteobacteria bacterium]